MSVSLTLSFSLFLSLTMDHWDHWPGSDPPRPSTADSLLTSSLEAGIWHHSGPSSFTSKSVVERSCCGMNTDEEVCLFSPLSTDPPPGPSPPTVPTGPTRGGEGAAVQSLWEYVMMKCILPRGTVGSEPVLKTDLKYYGRSFKADQTYVWIRKQLPDPDSWSGSDLHRAADIHVAVSEQWGLTSAEPLGHAGPLVLHYHYIQAVMSPHCWRVWGEMSFMMKVRRKNW